MNDACLWCWGTISVGDKFCCPICELKWHRSELATLEAQLAEAKKDSERLEWVIEHKAVLRELLSDCWEIEWHSSKYVDFPDRDDSGEETSREAIDAAMAQAEKGGQNDEK